MTEFATPMPSSKDAKKPSSDLFASSLPSFVHYSMSNDVARFACRFHHSGCIMMLQDSLVDSTTPCLMMLQDSFVDSTTPCLMMLQDSLVDSTTPCLMMLQGLFVDSTTPGV